MSHTIELRNAATKALDQMRKRGFDDAQATAVAVRQDEVNIARSEPSMLRSTDYRKLALVGIVGGRRASSELTDLRDDAVREGVEALFAAAQSAPSDPANKVSSGERLRVEQGPQESDVALLTEKARELLDFCRRETPKVTLVEGVVMHTLTSAHVVTTGGSELESRVGHHSMGAFGTAREGQKTSSFAYTGGDCHDLAGRPAAAHFGIDEMVRRLERQIHTRPVGAKFTGDVVLTPEAVADFMKWFLGQLCDVNLIAGNSLYRDRVGQAVSSKLLTLKSRFDGPGVTAITSDAFVAKPVEVLSAGVLKALTPSLYGSLKTGLPHVPTAGSGWELSAGDTPRDQLVSDTARGALVGRLSMGNPASNGDFSGVIKNSFLIENGRLGDALSETMITGNVAQMLQDVAAVSRERLDTGAFLLPWMRIRGLHFS